MAMQSVIHYDCFHFTHFKCYRFSTKGLNFYKKQTYNQQEKDDDIIISKLSDSISNKHKYIYLKSV